MKGENVMSNNNDSLEQLKMYFDNYLASMEFQINEMYFKGWPKYPNFGYIIEPIVNQRWPEIHYKYFRNETTNAETSVGIADDIQAEKKRKKELNKIVKYKKRYTQMIKNLEEFYPEMAADFFRLLDFGISQYQRVYNAQLDKGSSKK